VSKRRRFTLMPLIALSTLSALVTVPALSGMHLYAATTAHYRTLVVRPGDTLWSIASAHTTRDADVQETIDRISEINHLNGSSIIPGQRLHVPN